MLTKATLENQPWTEQLPMALFAARTFPNRDSGFSPYELVFGRNTITPLDLLDLCCRDYASTYIDDVLVYSADREVNKKGLARVIAALESAGITAKPGKCQFGRQHVEYLGHVIGCGSLAIPEHRVTAISDYKRPVNKKDMRAFLGLLSYEGSLFGKALR